MSSAPVSIRIGADDCPETVNGVTRAKKKMSIAYTCQEDMLNPRVCFIVLDSKLVVAACLCLFCVLENLDLIQVYA